MKFPVSHYLVISVLPFLFACSNLESKQDRLQKKSAYTLLREGKENVSGGQYTQAIDYFNIAEARFPQGALAEQVKLEKIYTHYLNRKPDLALQEADRFLKMYPDHPHADYVWYMKGLINFDRARSIVDRLLPPDQSKIDTQQLSQSLKDFEYLVQNYPDGLYTADAAKRIVHLRNTLAKAEMHVADYYMRRHAYIAAANRAQYVIDNFDQTPSVRDALLLQIAAYKALNLPQQAQDRERILRLNFPDA